MKSLLTRDEKPEGIGYAQSKTPIFSHVIVENFMGNEKVQGNVYVKPEESPEDRFICITHCIKFLSVARFE